MLSKNTIFFDLDGTLLPLDIDMFLKYYFNVLTKKFSDLSSPEELTHILMSSVQDMIKNDGKRTNKEVFLKSFFNKIDVKDNDIIMDRFDDFYQNSFPKLDYLVEDKNCSKELISLLKDKGYMLVLATNPLFPAIAIEKRIEWAGIKVDDFDFITTYENMHYTKPNLNYYQEILDKIEKKAQECVMVGNNPGEDIVAKKLGIKTFLITDFLIDKNDVDFCPDWIGSLKEFKEYVELSVAEEIR